MAPITWRNVNAPSFSDSNELRVAATNQLNKALGQVQGAVGDFAQGRADNQQKVTDLNTQDVINRISGLGDMEAYRAAQGQFNADALQGQNIDLKKVLSAYEGREDVLQNDYTQDRAYNQAVTAEKETPLVNEYNALIAGAKNPDDLSGISERLRQETGLRDTSALLKAAEERQRNLVNRGREETNYQNQQNLSNLVKDSVATISRERERVSENSNRFVESVNAGKENPVAYVDQAGNVLFSDNISKDERDALDAQYSEFTKENPLEYPSHQELIGRLMAAGGTPDQIAAATGAFNNAVTALNSIPTPGRNKVEKLAKNTAFEGEQLKQAAEEEKRKLDKEYVFALPESEFTQQIDPAVGLNKLRDKAPNSKFFAFGQGGEQLSTAYNTIIENGYSYTDDEGNKQSIEYPGVVLARAADLVPVNKEWFGGNAVEMEDKFKPILDREMAKWVKEGKKRDEYNQKVSTSNTALQEGIKNLTERAAIKEQKIFANYGVSTR